MWPAEAAGVVELGVGRLVRGRALSAGQPEPALRPGWGLYLLGSRPPATPWPRRWVRWRDFLVPSDTDDALAALREASERCTAERVEIACGGGVGRTGTALAALLVLEGCEVGEAMRTVRATYHPRAVETPWQRRWLSRVATNRGAR